MSSLFKKKKKPFTPASFLCLPLFCLYRSLPPSCETQPAARARKQASKAECKNLRAKRRFLRSPGWIMRDVLKAEFKEKLPQHSGWPLLQYHTEHWCSLEHAFLKTVSTWLFFFVGRAVIETRGTWVQKRPAATHQRLIKNEEGRKRWEDAAWRVHGPKGDTLEYFLLQIGREMRGLLVSELYAFILLLSTG